MAARHWPSAEDRFHAQYDRGPTCWDWTGAVGGDGYGVLKVDGRQVRAHRHSYELHCGPVPDGMLVMHRCDRPVCVNPAHLVVGTPAENAQDSARKARRPRGARNPAAKLTEGQVLALRAEYAGGGISQRALAARYGVSPALVSYIVTRKWWAHI